jgi:Tol biopolymer transport system component
LNRDVALKVLPEAFALDADRLARLKREAQVLASLNHPNIAAIYGFEDSGSVQALVLELVEGPTLAERIAQASSAGSTGAPHRAGVRGGDPAGPGLPVEEALPIAHQIAEALEAAHEHGVVHRDLKPSNIKITPDGIVKVLDFGLAKLTEGVGRVPASGPAGSREQDPAYVLSQSPTVTSPAMMTGVSVILGTAAYMAPEQAKGRPADKRADVWAFGCALYEMLTGRAPFAGEDVTDTLANVLQRELDWTSLPTDVPPALRALLKRCLEKDRRRRISDIAAALFAIDEAANLGAASAPTVTVVPPSLLRRVAVPFAPLVLGAALAATIVYFRPAPPEAPEMRLQIVTPPPGGAAAVVSFAISPDGQSIVFRAATEQTTHLWLRTLDSEMARPLAGTENATNPFWSPDGRSVGFFADQKLKRLDVAGGSVQTLADAPSVFGATWSTEGVILFSGANTAPLYRVPATGGQRPVEATKIDAPGQAAHRFPHFLPDGRHFLFFVTGTRDVQGAFVGSLDSMEATRVVDADTAAIFVPPDWVLFSREEALYAQRVDLDALTPVGEPLLVADRVARNPGTFASVALSAAASGLFAYRAPAENARELVWLQRQGRQTGTLGAISGLVLVGSLRLSPDGRTVAVERRVDGNADVWLIEAARGVLRRFTFDPANEGAPIWSPDGSRIVFQSGRRGGGLNDLYQKSLSGGPEQLLLESPENKNVSDWSPDGRFILFLSQNPKTARDIWALPLEGDRKPFVVVQTGFEENFPRFSPDGRWIVYQSNETGRNEVFVQPLPGPGRNWQISTNGGTQPQWRGDGREIFYLAPDNRLMAVPVTLDAKGTTVDAGNPAGLFPLRPGAGYAVTPDGQRFLVNTPVDEATASPITVVLNWKPRNQ